MRSYERSSVVIEPARNATEITLSVFQSVPASPQNSSRHLPGEAPRASVGTVSQHCSAGRNLAAAPLVGQAWVVWRLGASPKPQRDRKAICHVPSRHCLSAQALAGDSAHHP
jgi:hypothetical protein